MKNYYGNSSRARVDARKAEKKKLKENRLSEKAEAAEKKRAEKAERAARRKEAKDKKRKKSGGESFKPAKNIEIRRGKRTQPLGERLDYPGGFPVYLARYVLFGGEKPHAAMRFYNGSDAYLTGVRFTVKERNDNGKVIAEYTLERRGLNAERGTEFAVADAAVSADCAYLEVALEAALSDPYEYIVDGDGVTVRYGVRGEEERRYFNGKPACSVKKRKRALALLSVAAVICVTLCAALAAWRLGFFDKAAKNQTENTSISVTENVET